MENEKHDKELENEFSELSYEEIGVVLKELGTVFSEPIEKIPKDGIYWTLEGDYSIEKIRGAVDSARRAAKRRVERKKMEEERIKKDNRSTQSRLV